MWHRRCLSTNRDVCYGDTDRHDYQDQLCAYSNMSLGLWYVIDCIAIDSMLTVIDTCSWNGQVGNCCSGYCAASKCRSTDSRWPNCQEDNGLCLIDDNCCYGNKCVNGICTRPKPGA